MHAVKRVVGFLCLLLLLAMIVSSVLARFLFPIHGSASITRPPAAYPMHSIPALHRDADEHEIFLPAIAGGVAEQSAGTVILAHTPHIVKTTRRIDETHTRVTFRVRNTTGQLLSNLNISQHVDRLSGAFTLVEAKANPPFNAQIETGDRFAACRFSLTSSQPLAPGVVTEFRCLYATGPDSVFNAYHTLHPEPFPGYDDNYNQIGDELETQIQTWMQDGRSANPLPILILLNRLPEPSDAEQFTRFGGTPSFVATQVPVLGGMLRADRVAELATAFGDSLVMVGDDFPLDQPPFQIEDAIRATRVYNVWQGSLHGHEIVPDLANAFSGDASSSIAIIDSGIDGTHLAVRDKLIAWHDVLGTAPTAVDIDGHGSAVAGVAAGNEPVAGYRGVAYDTSLVGIRSGTLDEWTVGQQVAAIDWAIAQRSRYNIAVINNSIGYVNGAAAANPFWSLAARYAVQAGIVFVAAAGNGFDDVPDRGPVGSPGRDPFVLTVGAVNEDGLTTRYSSRGAAGPDPLGVIKPDVLAPGNAIRTLAVTDVGYTTRFGTSVAAPQVAGLAALLVDAISDSVTANGDVDGLTDEDLWDGIDNDGDDLVDEDVGPWFGSGESAIAPALLVKSIILMTAVEVEGGEVLRGDNGETANNPRTRSKAPTADGYDRGGKDNIEGYGRIAADAAVEALTQDFCAYDVDIFGASPGDKQVWARRLQLDADKEYTVILDGPDGADYDLTLYRGMPDPYGQPVPARQADTEGAAISGTTAGTADEQLRFQVRSSGLYFLVVRRVSGAGQFTVRLVTPEEWTIMVYVPAERPGEPALDELASQIINDLESVGSGMGSMRAVQILALVDYDEGRWRAGAAPGDAALFCIRKDNVSSSSRRSIVRLPAEVLDVDNSSRPRRSEANLGSPTTLDAFTSWAVDHFPARRYALLIMGDGAGHGWKIDPDSGTGPGSDAVNALGAAAGEPGDALDLGELRAALDSFNRKIEAGSRYVADMGRGAELLDLLLLGLGQMAMVEVAGELLDTTQILVASQTEFEGSWLLGDALAALRCRKTVDDWDCSPAAATDGAALARHLVTAFAEQRAATAQYAVSALRLGGTSTAECGTFAALVACIDRLATALEQGLEDTGVDPLTPADNVQTSVRDVRSDAVTSDDQDFVDLVDLARRLDIAAIPSVSKPHVAAIADSLEPSGNILVARARGPESAALGGLSIYFPASQASAGPTCLHASAVATAGCGLDNPSPSKRLYAADPDPRTPSQAGGGSLAALRFVDETYWDELLYRFVKPVAAVCADRGDGCRRETVVGVGESVLLRARGSSDGDSLAPAEYVWDLDLAVDSPAPMPTYPLTSAVAFDSPCSEDCDRNEVDTTQDDADARGSEASWTCTVPGHHTVRLMVYDEHQTGNPLRWNVDDEFATIHCLEEPRLMLSRSPAIAGQPFSVQIVAQAYPTATEPVTGSITLPLPPYLTVDTASLAADTGQADYDPAAHSVVWHGLLSPFYTISLRLEAVIDAALAPVDSPNMSLSATLDDGLHHHTLSDTATLIVHRAEPAAIAPGETVTYTIAFAAGAGPTDTTEVSLYVILPAGVSYDGVIEHPAGSETPTYDAANRIVAWSGSAEAESPVRMVYRATLDAETGSQNCDRLLTSTAQINDGIDNFGNVSARVGVRCPSTR